MELGDAQLLKVRQVQLPLFYPFVFFVSGFRFGLLRSVGLIDDLDGGLRFGTDHGLHLRFCLFGLLDDFCLVLTPFFPSALSATFNHIRSYICQQPSYK